MKKISNLQQLKTEKKRLHLQQQYLQQKIQQDWQELKFSLKPSTMAATALQQFVNHKTEQNLNGQNSILKTTLAYGISLLVKQFTDKAETIIKSKLKKNTVT